MMTMNKTLLPLCLMLFSLCGKSQSVSLSTGFGIDANNSKAMVFLPVAIKWQAFPDVPLLLAVNHDQGFTLQKDVEAFTLNPNLPESIAAKEKYKTSLLTIGIDIDIKLFSTSPANKLVLAIMPLGYSFHNTKVTYADVDKENYTILNGDLAGSPSGLVSAFGLQYLFGKNKLITLNIQSPLYRETSRDHNLRYAAPARLMFGYQFQYKKMK